MWEEHGRGGTGTEGWEYGGGGGGGGRLCKSRRLSAAACACSQETKARLLEFRMIHLRGKKKKNNPLLSRSRNLLVQTHTHTHLYIYLYACCTRMTLCHTRTPDEYTAELQSQQRSWEDHTDQARQALYGDFTPSIGVSGRQPILTRHEVRRAKRYGEVYSFMPIDRWLARNFRRVKEYPTLVRNFRFLFSGKIYAILRDTSRVL